MTGWPLGKLGDVLSQRADECRILDATKETFVTVRLYGKGALPRKIGDGKLPSMKIGYRLRSGDLVYSRIDARNGAFAIVPDELDGAVVSKDFPAFAIRKDRIHLDFLIRFLSTEAFFRQLQASSFGTTNRQRITEQQFLSYSIPAPPLAEQERIAKLLDEADHLQKLRAQADLRTAALFPAMFHEMFGRQINTPPVLDSLTGGGTPKDWRWARLTDVARLATGHTPSRRVTEYWHGDIPWISLTDIRALDGTIALATSQSVTEKGIENSSAVKLPKGTVCFSRTASVGFVTVMGREMCTSQDFVNWVCGDELDPIYLMTALMQAREYLRSLASGSTHKTIYFPTVEKLCVLVPPFPMQKEFASRVLEIHEMKAEQTASRERLDALFNSMLHRAYQGEL